MHRPRLNAHARTARSNVTRAAAIAAAVMLGSATPLDAVQPTVATLIQVGTANGFRATAEQRLANGSVVDTFRSSDAVIKVVGAHGSSVSFVRDPASRRIGLSMTTTRPKTLADAAAGQRAGHSAVAALIALGMDPQRALAEFGGLDTPDGSISESDRLLVAGLAHPGQLASARSVVSDVPAASQATVSTKTPYAEQCASVSQVHDLVQGYGCSTYYLVHMNGTDWRFTSKYKFSAQSVDHALFPLRLKQVAWGIDWAPNNVLTDWDPSATKAIGTCGTITIGSSGSYANISISATVCPDSIGPSGFQGADSGAIWSGAEHDNDFEAAIGTQEVHSPPSAPASFTSVEMVTFQCGTSC